MKTFFKFVLHYLNPLNTFLGLLIFFSFLSCSFYFFFTFYLKIKLSDEIFWPATLGVTGFTLIKFVETRTKRHNILCHLEVELNQAMDTLSTLIFLLENMIQKKLPIIMQHTFPYVTMDNIKEVGRLDIKNNLSNLLCDFRRITQDCNNLSEYGQENENAIINSNHAQHQLAITTGLQILNVILTSSKTAFTLIKDTLVLVRIYMSTDKPFFRFGQPFIWPCKLARNIDEERKKILSEIQKNQ